MENQVINNILNQIGPDQTAEMLEKGKKANIGEIRDWGGKKMQKTVNGWVPVTQGAKPSKKPENAENKLKEFLQAENNPWEPKRTLEFKHNGHEFEVSINPQGHNTILALCDGHTILALEDKLEDLDLVEIAEDILSAENEDFVDEDTGDIVTLPTIKRKRTS